MIRTLATLTFFASTLFAPWWLSVALAIFILSEWNAWLAVLFGGILMDIFFGTPIQPFGSAFLYTALFGAMVLITLYFRKRMLD